MLFMELVSIKNVKFEIKPLYIALRAAAVKCIDT